MDEKLCLSVTIWMLLLVICSHHGYARHLVENNLPTNFKYGNGTMRVYTNRKDYSEMEVFPQPNNDECYNPTCCWYDGCFMSAAKGCYHTEYGQYGCYGDCYPSCGGTRTRNAYRCRCYCCEHSDGWFGGTCETCDGVDPDYIYQDCPAICYNGGVEEGGECQCPDIYYGSCCSYDCPIPNSRCEKYFCDPSPPSECTWCWNNTETYKAYHLDSPECHPRCNWLGHWCWPGVCDQDQDYLASTCSCLEGFERYTPNAETTKCKLSHPPDIATCRLGAESQYGEAANSTFSSELTSCESTQDAYINFSPHAMFFQLDTQFVLPVDPPDTIKDYSKYVTGSSFGIINAEATVKVYNKLGEEREVAHHVLPDNGQVNCSVEVSRQTPADGIMVSCLMNTEYAEQGLQDGEKICHLFKVTASGYVLIQDVIKSTPEERFDEYGDTYAYEERCFRTDYTQPDHCANSDSPCQEDVLHFGPRIIRHKLLNTTFGGWYDPEPTSVVTGASGMKQYEVELREVHYTPTELFADFKSLATYVSEGGAPVGVPLPEREEPSVYALYLWALDSTQESPNYRTARRFVLTDNSSSVVINSNQPIMPVTASPVTDHTWQVQLVTIELEWTAHFHNSWHVHTNLLLPIRPDGNDTELTGVFEQLTGELPVSGTPNVDGVVDFEYAFFKLSPRGGNQTGAYRPVPDPLEQRLSLEEVTVQDGDVVTVSLRARDVMNNTEEDSVTINIDSSPPLIEHMYLVKEGYRFLYVHNSTDLSAMNMTFVAYDPHSGNKQVKWKLGHQPQTQDVGQGTLPVVRLNATDLCVERAHCYCPDIGQCQFYNYFIPLQGLIANDTHEGDHHRQYFFTFEIMNEAHLYTTAEVEILVDDSPPEAGLVFDGPVGDRDRDFQSDLMLQWHWEGFIDHESGITKYHYAVASTCQSKLDMQFIQSANSTNSSFTGIYLGETTETFASFEVDEVGFYRLSVIAFNGAMEPSVAVCSSGVLIDNTPPLVTDIHMEGSRHQKSVLCDVDSSDWFINEAGELRELSPSDACLQLCSSNETSSEHDELMLKRFPWKTMRNGTQSVALDFEESEEICSLFPAYDGGFGVYLATDNLQLSWGFEETESQMLDYFIGVSSSGEDVSVPDIKGFSSSHNLTHSTCAHCGLGQGELIYLVMEGRNKAGLSDLFSMGPLIIDMTPAHYQGGMTVDTRGDKIVLSWPQEAFYDDQDGSLLLEYEWAVGTSQNPVEVKPFTSKIFKYTDNSEEEANFTVEFNKDLLQLHNQDRDITYYFTLKCINKAGLHTVVKSDGFTIHSKVLPSSGIVYHVNVGEPDSTVAVGFQEDLTKLCARWYGFEHYQGNLNFHLGIGSLPGIDDVHPLSPLFNPNSNGFCVDGLTLEPLHKYYFLLEASNEQGSTNASSSGIFVASKAQVLNNGLIVNGYVCPKKFDNIIDTNITIETEITFDIYQKITSIPDLTLKLILPSEEVSSSLDVVRVAINGETVALASWQFSDDHVDLLYHWVQMSSNLSVLVSGLGVDVREVSLHACTPRPGAQSSAVSLHAQWTFPPEVDRHVSHFELAVVEAGAENASHRYIMDYTPVGDHKEVNLELPLSPGSHFHTLVSPCFSYTCVAAVQSQQTSVDPSKPSPGWVHASLNPDPDRGLADTGHFLLAAEWQSFVVSRGHEQADVYDWTIALDRTGAGSLLDWSRVRGDTPSIQESVHLPVYKHRDLFFIIRCLNKASVPILHPTTIQLLDLYPPAGVEVFDLPSTYDLDSLKDLLHSGNLGVVSKELHSADVDFTQETESISGAVLGVQCGQFTWTLQEGTDTNCLLSPQHEDCRDRKLTQENVVTFYRQSMSQGHHYFVCVHSTGGQCTGLSACSNGFHVDREHPVPGQVHTVSPAQSDPSTLLVSWTGFSDLEEETLIPYAHGISRYMVAVGSAPFEQDVRGFEDVGVTDHDILTGLQMQSGHQYFASVTGCDHVGLCSHASSQAVLIDTSPPLVGQIMVSFTALQLSPLQDQQVVVRWVGFVDAESAIVESQLAVGSTPHSQDIQPFTRVEGNQYTHSGHTHMQDGAVYYVQIKVVNGAGLWSVQSSEAILYDTSPPNTGYVRHGTQAQPGGSFTLNTDHLRVHWGGFLDPHTGIAFYRVAAGTQPHTADLVYWRDVALNNEFECAVDLSPGQPYFLTVEACNAVMLCSRMGAAPLVADRSPPVPGIIHVGFSEQHEHYQASSTCLSLHWVGFHDSESGLHHFEWCVVEDTVEECTQVLSAHTSTSVVKSGLDLPLHTPLHIILHTYNNVHLKTKTTSQSFIIDNTPPVVVKDVTVTTYGSLKGKSQFDRSYISLEWDIQDNDIPMGDHVISLLSHDDGVVPLENVMVGDIQNVTIGLSAEQQLKDGSLYNVKVSGCNAARLCTTSVSADLLVDSSPPLLGGFFEPMYWAADATGATLNLTWAGFADPHSNISHYYLMISSNYNGYDLSAGIIQVQHDQNSQDQQHSFYLPDIELPINSLIYLSIWAENSAGVTSDAAKTSVFVLPHSSVQQRYGKMELGELAIEKHSCEVQYCTNDCTCAVVNQQCTPDIKHTCEGSNTTDDSVMVQNGLMGSPQSITASSVCLPGHWLSELPSEEVVTRFEWSVSAVGHGPGFGVLDPVEEKVWFDVELYDRAVYCLPGGRLLQQGEQYMFHVRAWHDFSRYSHYQSAGVLTDNTPPRQALGRHVLDLDARLTEELDFTTDTSGVYAGWAGVFSDAETDVHHYFISIGTTQGGNELLGPVNVGLQLNVSFTSVSLVPGYKYFTTVYCFNPLGMVALASSDGFVVDLEPPSPGVVSTSLRLGDSSHQSSVLAASWYGFTDRESFIRQYLYAVTEDGAAPEEFESCVLQTSVEIPLSGAHHGRQYRVHVKAVDAAGHTSSTVTSTPVLVDQTPPASVRCEEYVEEYSSPLTCNCTPITTAHPHSTCTCQTPNPYSYTAHSLALIQVTTPSPLTARIQLNQHTHWLHTERLRHRVYTYQAHYIHNHHQQITPTIHVDAELPRDSTIQISSCEHPVRDEGEHPVDIKQLGRLGLLLDYPLYDPESGVSSVQVAMGTNTGGYQLLPFTEVGPGLSVYMSRTLQHMMQVRGTVTAENGAGGKSILTTDPLMIDWTAPVVSDIDVKIEDEGNNTYSITAIWVVTEQQSQLTDCLWKIGHIAGSSDILSSCPTLSLSTAHLSHVTLGSADRVHVTVTCANNLDLMGESHAAPVTVLKSPPSATSAFVRIHPQSVSYYQPEGGVQGTELGMEFSQGAFEDEVEIDHFQYRLNAGDGSEGTDWCHIGRQDHVLLSNLSLQSHQNHTVSVRAANPGEMYSQEVQASVWVNTDPPSLTGGSASWSLSENTLTIDWHQVFTWDSSDQPIFEVYAGSEEGSSDFTHALRTEYSSLSITSSKLRPPSSCHLLITCVSATGHSVTHRQTIYT